MTITGKRGQLMITDILEVAKPRVHSGFIKSIQFLMKGISENTP